MKKSELVKRLSDRFHERFHSLTAQDVQLAVQVILDGIVETLARGNRVEIRGFGCFRLRYRPPHPSRNPKTGAAAQVNGKHVPHFKAGKELRERVDG